MYCLYYKDELTLNIVENLCERSYCEYSNKLFSELEANYLSYILDDKKLVMGRRFEIDFFMENFLIKGKRNIKKIT